MSNQPTLLSTHASARSCFRRSLLVMTSGALLQASVVAQSTTRVSVNSSGAQGTWLSFDCAISGDGHIVAFQSSSTNLVAGDTNSHADIFVRDTWNSTTARVSLSTSGVQGDGGSIEPSLSADGRYVVFTSYAATFVAGDTNNSADIFLRDRVLGTTECVSLATSGGVGSGSSFSASISNDGRYVSFYSYASNLVVGDTNGKVDIFVRDRTSGTTVRASVSTGGVQGAEDSFNPELSGDGRFVVFQSYSSNLSPVDPNGTVQDVFLRDLVAGTTVNLTIGSPGGGGGTLPSISDDGRFVEFQSNAGDLIAGDTNFNTDVFVRDLLLDTIERASLTAGGGQVSGGGADATISGSGRFVVFTSWGTDVVAGDTNGFADIFVRDRFSATTERMSLTSSGMQPNNQCNLASISDDGRYVAFESGATNLVVGDTNSSIDAFLRDHTGPPPPLAFCFGDGTGAACPCTNGTAGNGCANSVNASGAHIAGSGVASVATDTFVLTGTGMPNGPAMYIQGTTQMNGGLGIVFGDGLLCTGGTILRLGLETNTAGSSQYPTGPDLPVSVKGLNTAGAVRTYQVWYRDGAVFCTPVTNNLSNGLQITWS